MTVLKNPTDEEIRAALARSRHRALRRIQDPRNGDWYYWPFEWATHAEGAKRLGVPYTSPPGAGAVVFDE